MVTNLPYESKQYCINVDVMINSDVDKVLKFKLVRF